MNGTNADFDRARQASETVIAGGPCPRVGRRAQDRGAPVTLDEYATRLSMCLAEAGFPETTAYVETEMEVCFLETDDGAPEPPQDVIERAMDVANGVTS